eukprot:4931677-Pyramimonas_sp.AAC.1
MISRHAFPLSTHKLGAGFRTARPGGAAEHLGRAMGNGSAGDVCGDATVPGAVSSSPAPCRAAVLRRTGAWRGARH